MWPWRFLPDCIGADRAGELIALTEYALDRVSQSAYKFKKTGDSLYGLTPEHAVRYAQRRFVLEAPSPADNTSDGTVTEELCSAGLLFF